MNSTATKKSGRRADGDCTCTDDLAALGHDLWLSVDEANLIRVANHADRPSTPFRILRREISKAGDLALGARSVTGYRWAFGLEGRLSLPDRPAAEEGVLIQQYAASGFLFTVVIYDRSINGAEVVQGLIAARCRLLPVGIDEITEGRDAPLSTCGDASCPVPAGGPDVTSCGAATLCTGGKAARATTSGLLARAACRSPAVVTAKTGKPSRPVDIRPAVPRAARPPTASAAKVMPSRRRGLAAKVGSGVATAPPINVSAPAPPGPSAGAALSLPTRSRSRPRRTRAGVPEIRSTARHSCRIRDVSPPLYRAPLPIFDHGTANSASKQADLGGS